MSDLGADSASPDPIDAEDTADQHDDAVDQALQPHPYVSPQAFTEPDEDPVELIEERVTELRHEHEPTVE